MQGLKRINRERVIHTRATDVELSRWTAAQEKLGIPSMSEFVRKACDALAKKAKR